jgi:hypothetical protein
LGPGAAGAGCASKRPAPRQNEIGPAQNTKRVNACILANVSPGNRDLKHSFPAQNFVTKNFMSCALKFCVAS